MQGKDDFQRDLREALRGEVRSAPSSNMAMAGHGGVAVTGGGNHIVVISGGAAEASAPRLAAIWWAWLFFLLTMGHVIFHLEWRARDPQAAWPVQVWQLFEHGRPNDILASLLFGAVGAVIAVFAGWLVRKAWR